MYERMLHLAFEQSIANVGPLVEYLALDEVVIEEGREETIVVQTSPAG